MVFVAVICLKVSLLSGQALLPNFSVENRGDGRVVISWNNPYPNLIQLAVQRSFDSLKRFNTVYSAASPQLPQNGFSDKIPAGSKVFYKIFYMMQGGTYYFTNSKSAALATDPLTKSASTNRRDLLGETILEKVNAPDLVSNPELYEPQKLYTILVNDSLYTEMLTIELKRFRDSILTKTKDTLVQIGLDTIGVKQFVLPFELRASSYVYTDKDGYIVVDLPDANKKKYDLVLLEEDETPVFELRQIKEPYFTIDKSNFYHGGLYKFVLWENGRIKERNKVFLPKE
ncbi:MAG: hypothetical protein EAY75_01130 [Bacteroidetes bacterium]|nr:MAG: hypothetical protein EAY75_01130 [Bacteroidota bacterium]